MWKAEWPKLSPIELATLVKRIMEAEGTEAEIAIMIKQFDANCNHPAKNGLIYYPDEYFAGNSDPSIEEIVQKAVLGI